ncbi:tetratricopeptide repeat protein [Silvanigrella aquatica]|uniref:Uncharacterized protein n=1 Tax=Silvanigrella aquatica TaxID=1915309 RepID=A0A1L4D2K3_9BACT|nr:tetratricopeptide repeat protein [Silvanigrella aquatica]APJ04426.1 hypothetical protein AXG55_11110 [Silvanigrella aquatica]
MKNKRIKKYDDTLCILLVEPSQELRTYFSNAIKSINEYTIIVATSAEDAYEVLSKVHKTIHFILFNWTLPIIPGYIFSQQIKNQSEYDHIELVAYSREFTNEDLFLISEIEINYTISEIITGKITKKMEEIRNDYNITSPILRKIQRLKHCILEENLKMCEEILHDEKIKQKIANNHKFFYLKGEVMILQKRYNEAIDFFQRRLRKNSKEKEIEVLRNMSTMGKAYCLAGRFKESLLIFKKLEQKSPRNLKHKVNTGEALLGLDKINAAEKKFNSVLEKNDTNQNAIHGMVKAKSILGHENEAMDYYKKLDGSFESRSIISYYNNKGVSLVRNGKLDEAIKFYKIALNFFEAFKGEIYFNLGMAYFRGKDIENAADCFKHALASENFDALTQKTLIKAFEAEGIENFIKKFRDAS